MEKTPPAEQENINLLNFTIVNVDECSHLVNVVDCDVKLSNAGESQRVVAHSDSQRISSKVTRQFFAFVVKRGAEDANLTIDANLLHNVANVVLKAEREHFVRFVEHNAANLVETKPASTSTINQTTFIRMIIDYA